METEPASQQKGGDRNVPQPEAKVVKEVGQELCL